ncbi:helix-turn-helix domain-containing protein [Streptacidiphilus sp. 4-A2]|nr:helix-turn-helix domain-containing protein [Streptacidiphilus sp. 4-A2]
MERGLAIKDVAPRIRASISKISRMERGENMPSERDVWDLVDFYGVRDAHRKLEIGDLLRQVKAPVWWQQYSDLTPGWMRRLIGLEDSAQEIRTYEMVVVPGLLQTSDYTRAVVKAGLPNALPHEIERRVALRAERQRILEGPGTPRLRVLLDESVLQRPRGGAQVMVQQLRHLKRMALRPGVSIRVVRYVRAANITPPRRSPT